MNAETLRKISRLLLALSLGIQRDEARKWASGKHTLSAWAGWKAYRAEKAGAPWWHSHRVRAGIIDLLFFFDWDHCHQAAWAENLLTLDDLGSAK
jgi:hypothetical protein